MWFMLYIRYWNDGHVARKYVFARSKWDLFAFIGWIYSTCLEKIERIDYTIVRQPALDDPDILDIPDSSFELPFYRTINKNKYVEGEK